MLITIVDRLFLVYMVMLFIRIVSSWFPELQSYRFMQFIAYYTDPYLNLFRKLLPPIGMIDFSPMIAFICLGVLEYATKILILILFY